MVQLSLIFAMFTGSNAYREGVSLVPVTLRIEMDLSEAVTGFMAEEVEAIWAPLGVRIVPVPPSAPAAATVVLRERPAISRIAGCHRDLHDHRLALTVLDRGLIVLWTHQVTRAARGDWDSDQARPLGDREMGRALGRVLAHELGHLLLGVRRHESSGLMRGTFRHRELTGRRSHNMNLSATNPDAFDPYQGHRERLARYLATVEAK